MRSVSLMGSSGSVGTQALDVVRAEPQRFRVHALAAHRSADVLVAQADEFLPDVVVIGDPALYATVRDGVPRGIEVLAGEEGLVAAARGADVVLNAVVGFAGLPVTMAALEAGRRLALANKESLIAGAPIVQKARSTPGRRDRPGRLRALRAAPVPGLGAGHDRRGPAAPHGVRRALPRLAARASSAR